MPVLNSSLAGGVFVDMFMDGAKLSLRLGRPDNGHSLKAKGFQQGFTSESGPGVKIGLAPFDGSTNGYFISHVVPQVALSGNCSISFRALAFTVSAFANTP